MSRVITRSHHTSLPKEISTEQQLVLDRIRAGESVIIDAVAGSGKTTTVLMIDDAFPSKRILQVTYNANLKSEVRNKKRPGSLLEVHTFHSLGYSIYTKDCTTDTVITDIIDDVHTPSNFKPFDIIIIDECQDMTELYFRFMRKFYVDNLSALAAEQGLTHHPQMVFIGDKYQCINGYKNADSRYLTLADELWADLMHPKAKVSRLTLSVSYRVTKQIAAFVNTSLLHCPDDKPRMIAANGREGRNVELCVGSYDANGKRYETPFRTHVATTLINMLTGPHKSVRPEDILIIMPSVKVKPNKQKPWQKMVNELSARNIPVWSSQSDDYTPSNRDQEGKVVISTIHGVKGIGRKVVVAYDFSMGYYEYYDRTGNVNVCPNVWYVAATRSKQHLILVGGKKQEDIIPFLYIPKDTHSSYLTITDHSAIPDRTWTLDRGIIDREINKFLHVFDVTGITRLIDGSTQTIIEPLVDSLLVKVGNTDEIHLPTYIASNIEGCEENISAINSDAVMEVWEAKKRGNNTTVRLNELITKFATQGQLINKKLTDGFDLEKTSKKSLVDSDPSEYLHTAALYKSEVNGLMFIYSQLKGFSWLSRDKLLECMESMRTVADKDIDYYNIEVEVGIKTDSVFMQKDGDKSPKPVPCTLLSNMFPEFADELKGHYMNLVGRIDLMELEESKSSTHLPKAKYQHINNVYEFKLKQAIGLNDKVQLIVYACILDWNCRACNVPFESRPKKYTLYNIRNHDHFCFEATPENMMIVRKIVYHIIVQSFKLSQNADDSAFRARNTGVAINPTSAENISALMERLTIPEIKAICKENGVTKYSTLNKPELKALAISKIDPTKLNTIVRDAVRKKAKSPKSAIPDEYPCDEYVYSDDGEYIVDDSLSDMLSGIFI